MKQRGRKSAAHWMKLSGRKPAARPAFDPPQPPAEAGKVQYDFRV